MAATVHFLHPRPTPIAGFLRVGHTGHRQIAGCLASGRLPFRRVVFEAAHLPGQLDLLASLRSAGCEIVLDPNFAEMAALGRYEGAVSRLPWANPNRPWALSDFVPGRNANLAKLIAEFAVQHQVNAVLAPTHLLETINDGWFHSDKQFCERLRKEIDQMGGRSIAIDYQLITTMHLLKDDAQRQQIAPGIRDLPIDNIWVRASGFGATATGVATRNFIELVRQLHETNRPIVGDYIGGFAGLSALAFGAISGISHGIGQKETFDAYSWKRPRSSSGGSARRIYIPDLDRYLTGDELHSLFRSRGARSRFACNDTNCCASIDDMFENNHAHFLRQRASQIEDLSAVEEIRRAEHLLLKHIDPAVRAARQGTRLKVADEIVKKAVDGARSRLSRLRDVLGHLHSHDDAPSRSRPVVFRGGGGTIAAILGS